MRCRVLFPLPIPVGEEVLINNLRYQHRSLACTYVPRGVVEEDSRTVNMEGILEGDFALSVFGARGIFAVCRLESIIVDLSAFHA